MKNETCLRKLALPLLGKWSIFILLTLEKEEMYFAQLERTIGSISRKLLTQSLNELIEINILYKRGESSTGHKTFYGLTPLGQSLLPLIYQIKEWIREHKDELQK